MAVYDVDTDRVSVFDFASLSPARCPDSHCWDVEEPKLLAVQTHAAPGGDASAGLLEEVRLHSTQTQSTVSHRQCRRSDTPDLCSC